MGEVWRKFGVQDVVEEAKPDRKVLGLHIACPVVLLHRVARIGPFAQDRVAPKAGDFVFVFGPIVDVVGEDGCKIRILAHRRIEFANNRVDLICG